MPQNATDREAKPQQVQKSGNFPGIFTPGVLTILDLIMYRRFGRVVGNVGLIITILIVLLSGGLNTTIFVCNAGKFAGQLI